MLKRLSKPLTALDSQQMGLSFLRPLCFELTFYLPRGRHVTSMLRVFRVARWTPRDQLCLAKIQILYAFMQNVLKKTLVFRQRIVSLRGNSRQVVALTVFINLSPIYPKANGVAIWT